MFRDKSKLLLLGALVVLVLTLADGSFFSHGFGLFHFHGWTRILLIAFAVWLLLGCRGCRCGSDTESDDSTEDSVDEESD